MKIIVVPGIHDIGEGDLLQVVEADHALGLLLGLGQRWQQHRGENGDDGDHNQQLNQGESRISARRRFHYKGSSHVKSVLAFQSGSFEI